MSLKFYFYFVAHLLAFFHVSVSGAYDVERCLPTDVFGEGGDRGPTEPRFRRTAVNGFPRIQIGFRASRTNRTSNAIYRRQQTEVRLAREPFKVVALDEQNNSILIDARKALATRGPCRRRFRILSDAKSVLSDVRFLPISTTRICSDFYGFRISGRIFERSDSGRRAQTFSGWHHCRGRVVEFCARARKMLEKQVEKKLQSVFSAFIVIITQYSERVLKPKI